MKTRTRIARPENDDQRAPQAHRHDSSITSILSQSGAAHGADLTANQTRILALQKSHGNAAVQRFLAQRTARAGSAFAAFDSAQGAVQRWPWDDDESKESESSEPSSSSSSASDYSSDDSKSDSDDSGDSSGGASYQQSTQESPGNGDDSNDDAKDSDESDDKPWWQFWGDDKDDDSDDDSDDDKDDDGDEKPWWQFWGDDKDDDSDDDSGDDKDDDDEKSDEDMPTAGDVDPLTGSPVSMGMACDIPRKARKVRRRVHDAATDPIPTVGRDGRPLKVKTHLSISSESREGAAAASSLVAHDDAKTYNLGNNLDFGSIDEYGATGIPGNTAFGYTAPTFTIDNIKWTRDQDTINIYARLYVKVNWAVRGNNNTNIPNGDDPFITKTNWQTIADDLTPNANGEAPRNLFWASDLTIQHEMVHVNEFINNSKAQIPTLASFINSQNITVPEDTPADKALGKINSQVSGILGQVRGKAESAVKAAFDNGGELRAYKDGKAGYSKRAADIKAYAKKKGWTT